MSPPRFVPAPKIKPLADDQILKRARQFYEAMRRRRTIRDYSDRPVPRKVIEYCIRAAGTAPSGANLQPWHFVAVSDAAIKRQIRVAAEKEEKEFYEYRAPKAWLRRRFVASEPEVRQPVLQLPLPSAEVLQRGAAALQALVAGLSIGQNR